MVVWLNGSEVRTFTSIFSFVGTMVATWQRYRLGLRTRRCRPCSWLGKATGSASMISRLRVGRHVWSCLLLSESTHFIQVTMSGPRRTRLPPSPTGAWGSPTRTRRWMTAWWNATMRTVRGNGEWTEIFQYSLTIFYFILPRYDMDCNVNQTYEDAAWGELHALCEGQNGFWKRMMEHVYLCHVK